MKRMNEIDASLLIDKKKKKKKKKMMMMKKVDVVSYSEDELMVATVVGDLEKVSNMVKERRGRSVDFTTKLMRNTPLFEATRRGFTDIARVLIQNGADVNCPTCDGGETPMFNAILNQDSETCRLLLENGGKTCKWHLQLTHKPEMIRLLICWGVPLMGVDTSLDSSILLGLLRTGIDTLRSGERLSKSYIAKFMSQSEASLLRDIAFAIAIQFSGCYGFATYYRIRSFITFHGIFIADWFADGYRNMQSGPVWYKEKGQGSS